MVKFRNCNLLNVSFLDSNIEKVQFENCHFWEKDSKDEKIFDEKNLKDNSEISDYKSVEKIYIQLQENFAKNGEISESVKFAEGKFRVAEQRIKNRVPKEKQAEQLEFLCAEIKKRYDDLSLYSIGEKFFIKEMEAKIEKEDISGSNIYSLLNWYKWISNFNTSPLKALMWIIGTILVFAFIFSIQNPFKEAFDYSFTNAIPFIESANSDFIKKILENDWLKYFSYIQKILSAGIILLFGLSLRRKFKR